MASMYEHFRTPELASLALRVASSAVPEDRIIIPNEDPDNFDVWVDATAAILKPMLPAHESVVHAEFKIDGDIGAYSRLVNTCNSNPRGAELRRFLYPAAPSGVIDDLAESIKKGSFDLNNLSYISNLRLIDVDWDWNRVVKAIGERLDGTGQLPKEEVSALLQAAFDLDSSCTNATDILTHLASEGAITHHIYNLRSNPDTGLTLCYLTQMLFEPDPAAIKTRAQTSIVGVVQYRQFLVGRSDKAIEMLGIQARMWRKIPSLLENAERTTAILPIVKELVAQAAADEHAPEHLAASEFIEHYLIIEAACSDEVLINLEKHLIQDGNLVPTILARPFSATLATLYAELFGEVETNDLYRSYLLDGLRELDKGAWAEALAKEDDVFNLALLIGASVRSAGTDGGLTTALQDALFEHAKKLLAGDSDQPGTSTADWNSILYVLSVDSREILLRKISDLMCESAKTTSAIIDLYGKPLSESSAVIGNKERVALYFFKNAIERAGEQELKWIVSLLERRSELRSVSRSVRRDLAERISLRLGGDEMPSSATRPLLEKISGLLWKKRSAVKNAEQAAV